MPARSGAGGWVRGQDKGLHPPRLFLTIDPERTEGQQARNRCIRADRAAVMEGGTGEMEQDRWRLGPWEQ